MTARFFLTFLSFFSVRISKAADFKDHKIQVASCLISLKVEPSPALSSSLLGGPLIKIVLTHLLVSLSNGMPQFPCVCDSRRLSVCLLGKELKKYFEFNDMFRNCCSRNRGLFFGALAVSLGTLIY